MPYMCWCWEWATGGEEESHPDAGAAQGDSAGGAGQGPGDQGWGPGAMLPCASQSEASTGQSSWPIRGRHHGPGVPGVVRGGHGQAALVWGGGARPLHLLQPLPLVQGLPFRWAQQETKCQGLLTDDIECRHRLDPGLDTVNPKATKAWFKDS